MKRILLILVAILFTSGLFGQHREEKTKETWHGKWKTATGKSGKLVWPVVTWEQCCGLMNMQVKGKVSDSYGISNITGSCAMGKCSIKQKYIKGRYKGRTFMYEGSWNLDMRTRKTKSITGKYGQAGKMTSTFSFTKFVKR